MPFQKGNKINIGRVNCRKGTKMTDEQKAKMSAAKKDYYQTHEHFMAGKKRSAEAQARINAGWERKAALLEEERQKRWYEEHLPQIKLWFAAEGKFHTTGVYKNYHALVVTKDKWEEQMAIFRGALDKYQLIGDKK